MFFNELSTGAFIMTREAIANVKRSFFVADSAFFEKVPSNDRYRVIPDFENSTFSVLAIPKPEMLSTTEKPTLSPELQALVDRQEFLEDCIAEMASVIYSGEGGEES